MRRNFQQRAETFGFDTRDPWALDAFNLLFRVPRVYEPLVAGFEARYGNVRTALDRLTKAGWVAHQDAVRVDAKTGQLTQQRGKRVDRYVTTSAGRRLALDAREDPRVIEDRWGGVSAKNVVRVADLLAAFDVRGSHRDIGVSAAVAVAESGLAERTGRWWVAKLLEGGFLRQLETKESDRRDVIPAHWRPTRQLARQLDDVLSAFDGWGHLSASWRLSRSRYLDPIDPARISSTGATDFDHDVTAQLVLASFLRSEKLAPNAPFDVEPRIALTVRTSSKARGIWRFDLKAHDDVAIYQPDGVLVDTVADGRTRRNVVEYERHQTRRDGWVHLERFCGYVVQRRLPFEPVALRFVVDSDSRVRSYTELIEAFADHLTDNQRLAPPNEIQLYVGSVGVVTGADDPFDDRIWHRLTLPMGDGHCVLHHRDRSPYDQYFSRSAS